MKNIIFMVCCMFCFSMTPSNLVYGQSPEENIDLREDYHTAIISLAYSLRKNPWLVEELNEAKEDKLLPIYDRLEKGFSAIGSFEDKLGFIDQFCVLQVNQKGHFCTFNISQADNGNLFVTDPSAEDLSMLMILSYTAPERTLIFRWDKDLVATSLYDSFESEHSFCTSNDRTPLRTIYSVTVHGNGVFTFLERGNMESEFEREFTFTLDKDHCRLEGKIIKEDQLP